MTAPAYPNLHRIAYGEGARLTAEARVEAADALERLEALTAALAAALDALGRALAESLTPAHDKEKS